MFEILYQICYVSSANEKFQQTELLELLNQARQYNKNNNITGLLLYDGVGTFLQTLEGEKDDVESLLSKIKMDERHKRVNLLSAKLVEERLFANWSMGFRLIDKTAIKQIDGFSDFMYAPEKNLEAFATSKPNSAMNLLYHFAKISAIEPEDIT